MSSGKIHRPVLSATDEKAFLNITGIKTKYISLPANATYYMNFTKQIKDGVLLIGRQSSGINHGIYIFGSTSTGSISITPVKAVTASGFSITGSGNYLTFVNGASALYMMIIQYYGDLPTWSATQPT